MQKYINIISQLCHTLNLHIQASLNRIPNCITAESFITGEMFIIFFFNVGYHKITLLPWWLLKLHAHIHNLFLHHYTPVKVNAQNPSQGILMKLKMDCQNPHPPHSFQSASPPNPNPKGHIYTINVRITSDRKHSQKDVNIPWVVCEKFVRIRGGGLSMHIDR